LRIIICDDGSDTMTKNILSNLQQKYSEIFIITNEKNRGSYYCRWRLIQEVTTDYFTFLDSDDELAKNFFNIAKSKIENYDMLHFARYVLKEENLSSDVVTIGIFSCNFIWGIVFKTSYVKKLNYDILKDINLSKNEDVLLKLWLLSGDYKTRDVFEQSIIKYEHNEHTRKYIENFEVYQRKRLNILKFVLKKIHVNESVKKFLMTICNEINIVYEEGITNLWILPEKKNREIVDEFNDLLKNYF